MTLPKGPAKAPIVVAFPLSSSLNQIAATFGGA